MRCEYEKLFINIHPSAPKGFGTAQSSHQPVMTHCVFTFRRRRCSAAEATASAQSAPQPFFHDHSNANGRKKPQRKHSNTNRSTAQHLSTHRKSTARIRRIRARPQERAHLRGGTRCWRAPIGGQRGPPGSTGGRVRGGGRRRELAVVVRSWRQLSTQRERAACARTSRAADRRKLSAECSRARS